MPTLHPTVFNRGFCLLFYKRLVEVFSNSRHQWMWDEPSLLDALAQQGFKNIRQRDYGEWSDQRFEAVEKQDRHWNAICMEATK